MGTNTPAPSRVVSILAVLCVTATLALAQRPGADELDGFRPTTPAYDESVPTPNEVLGHRIGERMSSHREMETYLAALADASDRVVLKPYGTSWEGRRLWTAFVGSSETIAKLESIRENAVRLADPRSMTREEADAIESTLPAIVWLAYCVHGNEASGTDAGLALAYELAAAIEDPVVDAIRTSCLVVIDPVQNPDGREHFVQNNRRQRGRFPDPDPISAEHTEPWPSGRVNHYLLDMNRDWFSLTQPETRARIDVYRQWMPHVFADVHEMGGDSSYYFPPPAQPINPHMRSGVLAWTETLGRNHARWFDRLGFDYFTREVFDSFFPGYGESWPLFQGAIGMTYEAAGTGGLVRERRDDTVQHYRDAVRRHFIASLSTCEAAALHRDEIVSAFRRHREDVVRTGAMEAPREYLLPPNPDADRVERLVSLLIEQGIEVDRATAPFKHRRVSTIRSDALGSQDFPTGTYRVSLAQPCGPLVRTLLDRETAMDPDFLEEQRERLAKLLDHQIYDITAWSLPLLFDVACYRGETTSTGSFERVTEPPRAEGRIRALSGGDGSGTGDAHPKAEVAYLLPWDSSRAARALAHVLRDGLRASSAGDSFVIGGREFPAGTIIIPVIANANGSGKVTRASTPDVHTTVRRIADEIGVTFFATDTSWVEEGVHFGSDRVRHLRAPRVALLWGAPTSAYSAGATRFILEQSYDYPVTALPVDRFSRADLSRYDVLIAPAQGRGSYASALSKSDVARLATWVRQGGTLVALGSAVAWLTSEDVGLLPIEAEKRATTESEKTDSSDYADAIRPEVEDPVAIPGAILEVTLDTEHWLGHGTDGTVYAVADARRIFSPIRIDQGQNVGRFASRETILASGVAWDETLDQAAGKPWLVERPTGRGHVIGFVEDPTFRASIPGLEIVLLNAVLRGPSF